MLVSVLCLLLLTGISSNYLAFAAMPVQGAVFELFWQNAASISLDMQFSGGVITSTGRVNGQSGTTAISATFTLARQNTNGTFTEVDTWTATNGAHPFLLSTSRTTSDLAAGTYRLSVSAGVTRNGWTENVSGNHTMTFR